MTPDLVAAHVVRRPGAVWLDGGAHDWHVLVWGPEEVVRDGHLWPEVGRGLSGRGSGDAEAPFHAGCVGYVGFGAGHRVQPVPAGPRAWEPEVWLGRYPGALCYHPKGQRWVATGEPERRAEARALLEQVASTTEAPPGGPVGWWTTGALDYQQRVRRILEWIHAGDCYQVNLTRPVWVDPAPDPWQTYLRMRGDNAAAWGAFMNLGHNQFVASNSPEQFLSIRDRRVVTRPIKGTRPRHEDAERDAQLREALRNSAKDQAELTMIVDLVRNDLGRVCRPDSIGAGPRVLERHANVHHASQEVHGDLHEGRDAWDALAAAFPPGSVTGAPKVRACQRIAELERHARGVYCGSIGYVDASGNAEWNVAIRTAVWDGARARYHVGGGIVAASDPAEEWDETCAKGRVLAAAMGIAERGSGRGSPNMA